jgi:hypothetical protein
MLDVFTTNYWAKEYEQPPLKLLERVDDGDVEMWVNQFLPFVGAGVDWSRVRGSHRHWRPKSAAEAAAVVVEFLAALPGSADVVHVGDSLSPYSVRIRVRISLNYFLRCSRYRSTTTSFPMTGRGVVCSE